MSTQSKIASKLADLKVKATKIEVVEVDTPVIATDLLKQFKSASGGTTDTANEFIIDVFPNFIPILCYVMMLANRAATQCDYKTHAKCSPPTIIMYYVFLIYGYFLVSDAFVRPIPSIHARIWKTEALRLEFMHLLMSLPVPEELITVLHQFAPTSTERSTNVFFIPSFAGFSHDHFFGKFIPAKLFADIHSTVASVPGNSSVGTIYNRLFKRSIAYTITNPASQVDLAQILGITIKNNNEIHTPATRLFQVFENVFNPVLFRDFHRRSSLARIPLEAPEFDTTAYNAYDAILSFTGPNSSEFDVVLRSTAAILQSTVMMKQSLAEVVASSSGIAIVHHGYSIYAMPTWSATKPDVSKITKDSEIESDNVKTFASDIGYLKKSAIPKADNSFNQIKVEDNTGKDASTTHRVTKDQYPLVNRHHKDIAADIVVPTDDDFILFDPTEHVAPKVRVLDVNNTGTTEAYLATLCGKVIESFELDGNTVPVPNTDIALGLENSSFADSALPLSVTVPATAFYHGTTSPPVPPQVRIAEREDLKFSAAHLLFDRTIMRLPYIGDHIRATGSLTAGQAFSGFTKYATNCLHASQSFIGLKTIAPDAPTSEKDDTARTPEKTYYVWSPYTLTTRQDPNSMRSSSSYNRTYFLTNLRTLFGTDYNLVEINGAYHAMPSS